MRTSKSMQICIGSTYTSKSSRTICIGITYKPETVIEDEPLQQPLVLDSRAQPTRLFVHSVGRLHSDYVPSTFRLRSVYVPSSCFRCCAYFTVCVRMCAFHYMRSMTCPPMRSATCVRVCAFHYTCSNACVPLDAFHCMRSIV